MTRLPFRLQEWTPRVIWTGVQARQVWEPKIQRISQVWQAVERLLITEKARPSALQNIAPESLPEAIKQASEQNLIVLPLSRTGKVAGYQSATQILGATDEWDYRCAITTADLAAEWAKAWQASDNDGIGRLLGYPECCRKFFQQVWVQERCFDTTWRMANSEQNTVEVQPGINILWRWHGLRTVSHLPCSFQCAESIDQGNTALKVMGSRHPQEAAWLEEILNWPVEWSALHGIAELRTPVTRTVVATDATAEKLVVKYLGTGYPLEGASGLTFPFKYVTMKPSLRLSNSKDNGFATHAGMQEAHGKLLAELNPPYNTVLDLGCGDGVLLSKIAAKRRVGIESDDRVAMLASNRVDNVIIGNCMDAELVNTILNKEKPDLVIAQNKRNPAHTLTAPAILSYNYETGYVRLHRRHH